MRTLPDRISRYEIKTLIGEGGMGSLYLARDTNPNTNRLVALKLLNATLDSAELRDRFARESRALASLNHPHIVAIYDSGEYQGAPFIAMEYVRGETLAEKIKRRAPMSLAQKLDLMVELCSGLAHAHQAGIVHRDIKPANLMVDQDGRLKVLDFGIARMADGTLTVVGVQLTQLDMRIGSPGYMSPEQIEGRDIDRRTDVFAAGVACYELLSYREAFTGANDREIETKILKARPEPLTSFVPDLDPAIEAVVNRALAKNPRDRYQDAVALEEALQRERAKLGPAEPAPRKPKPAPPAPAGLRARDSRADAAYQRATTAFTEGALDAARRFAIEALAEDPDHQKARSFLERIGPGRWPVPPPSSPVVDDDNQATVVIDRAQLAALSGRPPSSPSPSPFSSAAVPRPTSTTSLTGTTSGTSPRTVASTGQPSTGGFGSAPTLISTAPAVRKPARGKRLAAMWVRHRKALQIAGIATLLAGVVALIVLGVWALIGRDTFTGGVTLTVTRPSGGRVWSTNGIRCGTNDTECTATIAAGQTVELRAGPDDGYVFGGFGGDCTANGLVQMSRASLCTATFSKPTVPPAPDQWPLTIAPPANGTVVASGGLYCGSQGTVCSVSYAQGTEVKLTASADAGFELRGYTGDCAGGVVNMTGARVCGAQFLPGQVVKQPTAPPPFPLLPPKPPKAPVKDVLPAGTEATGAAATGADPGKPDGPLAEAPAAPPLPQPSPEELAKKEIQAQLERYRFAYQEFDVEAIKQVWPKAPADGLKRQFDQYTKQKFAMQGPLEFVEVNPARNTAVVKAVFEVKPEPKLGTQKPYKREETFRMERQMGFWVIVSWSSELLK